VSDRKKYTRRDVLFIAGLAAVVAAAVGAVISRFREGIAKAINPTASPGRTLGKEFQYDISELTRIDPALIAFDHTGEFQVDFAEPRGLAVDGNGRIYVAGPNAVSIFSLQGRKLSTVSVRGRPNCLAVAEDGKLYVGMTEHVEVYGADGTLAAEWPSLGEDSFITAVAVSGERVAVADYGKRVVVCFDTAGREVNRLGAQKGDLAFETPSPYFDLAFAPDGMLRVVNPGRRRIEAWMLDGNREFHWGADGEGVAGFVGCCNPAHIAILPDGGIVTSEKGIQRIKVFKADRGFGQNGQLDCVVAAPETFTAGRPLEVAGDSAGRVIVLDSTAGTVHVFSPGRRAEGT